LSVSPETGIPVSRPLNYSRETGIRVCLLTEYENYTQWAGDGDILSWVDRVYKVKKDPL